MQQEDVVAHQFQAVGASAGPIHRALGFRQLGTHDVVLAIELNEYHPQQPMVWETPWRKLHHDEQ